MFSTKNERLRPSGKIRERGGDFDEAQITIEDNYFCINSFLFSTGVFSYNRQGQKEGQSGRGDMGIGRGILHKSL